jgi:quinoprotein glucose dehydrogenase
MTMIKIQYALILGIYSLYACTARNDSSWPVYRGDNGSNAYSPLVQIDTSNVKHLQVAWAFHSGDAREGNKSTIQCNPILANGLLYITSPQLKVIALEPGSGRHVWSFDPFDGQQANGVNRGVAYWQDEAAGDKRIFMTADHWLYALNADDGKPVIHFGDSGKVDIREGLGRDPASLMVNSTTPGTVYKDKLILGTRLGEGYGAAPGHVRAYNVRSGEIDWIFHTIPQPGEFGYNTWPADAYRYVGGANVWGGMSLDEEREWVFLATGSPSFDFYGGYRGGQNLFGNTVIALDANTGERQWHYQTVHHDLWDYDLPTAPNLVRVQHGGRSIDAVAQITKMGFVFLLDRDTGEPLFPVVERAVPQSSIMEESLWPTQPFPTKPPPFVRQSISEADITDLSAEARAYIKNKFEEHRHGPIYTPPSLEGTIFLPGTRGGGEWSGAAFDYESGWLYVSANELPSLLTLRRIENAGKQEVMLSALGQNVYTLNNCAGCHGLDRRGQQPYPSLTEIGGKYARSEVESIIRHGRGLMPATPGLSDQDMRALLAFLYGDELESVVVDDTTSIVNRPENTYAHTGWYQLLDQEGRPGIKPPWGTLTAIDLNEGSIKWQVPLGEYPGVHASRQPTGTQNFGGAVVTRGGLVFIAATKDEKIRAFRKTTGELLWEHKLPYGGYATPAVFMYEGKQYILIAAGGGGKVGTPSGDAYVAFSLPY